MLQFTNANYVLIFKLCLSATASITVLFKHVGSAEEPGSDETIREKVLCFIRDKVKRLIYFLFIHLHNNSMHICLWLKTDAHLIYLIGISS